MISINIVKIGALHLTKIEINITVYCNRTLNAYKATLPKF